MDEKPNTATIISLINMKGGVGKTTLTFNLAWYCAWQANLKVLAVDLDPQSNLSQYFMGAAKYKNYIENDNKTIVDIFEQFSSSTGRTSLIKHRDVIYKLHKWSDGSILHLLPSRLELAMTLKNPTEKAQLLPQFLSTISQKYDIILIDCAPTESILTTAAYKSSRYIIVPVKPEFLATIGFPLLGRSLREFKLRNQDHELDMAGVLFNDMRRSSTPPEQKSSCKDVKSVAVKNKWPVFKNAAHHSDSYPTGSRDATPIFRTSYAREYVIGEFHKVANEFLKKVGIK